MTLMRTSRKPIREHTVLMVQVENEPGTWDGGARLFTASAASSSKVAVPTEVWRRWTKRASPNRRTGVTCSAKMRTNISMSGAFRNYIGQVAAAGKAIYPLPMYVNASVRDPFKPGRPPKYECGGPNDNVFPIWKAEAPAVDLLAPDIYQRESANFLKLLDFYHRADNPLFVPESIGQGPYARFLFAAMGHGAIGYAPFGLDYTRNFDSQTDPSMTRGKNYCAHGDELRTDRPDDGATSPG